MNIQLGDIMKVEDDLNIHLTEQERKDILDNYYVEVQSEQNKFEIWSDIVENLIYQIKSNN
jgi:hypothetical protein